MLWGGGVQVKNIFFYFFPLLPFSLSFLSERRRLTWLDVFFFKKKEEILFGNVM
jgi:hypothetical protein